MDYLNYHLYSGDDSELNSFQAAFGTDGVDFTDLPLGSSLAQSFLADSRYYVAQAGANNAGTIQGLDFNLANTFWGCQFSEGYSPCGVHIRQGIAHLIDKQLFTETLLYPGGAVDDPAGYALPQTPNPCGWDSVNPQTGPGCVVGSDGGTAYHLSTATGKIFPWQPDLGSLDFCAAAKHFVAAGLASGVDKKTCVLTGISSQVASSPVSVYIRTDNTDLNHLGNGITEEICALFTGSFDTGCPVYLRINLGTTGEFTGFLPDYSTSPRLDWWIYTSGGGSWSSPNPFQGNELYSPQNPPSVDVPTPTDLWEATIDIAARYFGLTAEPDSSNPLCGRPSGILSYKPSNYVYLCNSSYDNFVNLALSAPCVSAPGDPIIGQTNPTFATCPGTTQSTLTSAVYKAEQTYGQGEFGLPVFISEPNNAYLSNWQRAIYGWGGDFNFFTWLNTYSTNPLVPSTIRQGLRQPTSNLNPFIASQASDLAILATIYDSPQILNPEDHSQLMDWMTLKTDTLPASSLSYTAPPGTVDAFRYSLRDDIFWQSGQKVTSWDMAFSFIAFDFTGAYLSSDLLSVTGVKVLSPTQIDVDVNVLGLTTKGGISSTPIIPGRFWADRNYCSPESWDAAASNSNFASANAALTNCIAPSNAVTSSGVIMPIGSHVDPKKIVPGFDPLPAGILVGSGAWVCVSSSGTVGQGCSSDGTQHPGAGGSFRFRRNGFGTVPGGTVSNTYFRSSGNLALWAWSGDRGVFSSDFLNVGAVSSCYGKPVGTQGCTQWQYGIGGSPQGTVVGLTQVSIVQRFVGVNWVSPYSWDASPPTRIATFPPTLYEGFGPGGIITLKPCSVDPINGYDC